MKQGIHLVTEMEELAQLRRLTIGQSDFKVVDAALAVDAKDEVALNLGHYENGRLVATMRFYPVYDAAELERQLDYQGARDIELTYPGVVVG